MRLLSQVPVAVAVAAVAVAAVAVAVVVAAVVVVAAAAAAAAAASLQSFAACVVLVLSPIPGRVPALATEGLLSTAALALRCRW